MARRKVAFFMPPDLVTLMDDVAKRRLGIGRSAFAVAAVMLLTARFLSIVPSPKRRLCLEIFERMLVELREDIEKAL